MDDQSRSEDVRFVHGFYAATLGHLYIAWIHPFGDGNGRTARLLEAAVLANSGIVPWISANLLSNHYNATRSVYYRRLAGASREPDGVEKFLAYAAEGFVDNLREQIDSIQAMQRKISWISYIHEKFRNESDGATTKRRRDLVLSMPTESPTPAARLRLLTTELAVAYAGKGPKTLSRDVNRLKDLGLITGHGRAGYQPNIAIMDSFLPRTQQWGIDFPIPVRVL
jgi:Fic family protein